MQFSKKYCSVVSLLLAPCAYFWEFTYLVPRNIFYWRASFFIAEILLVTRFSCRSECLLYRFGIMKSGIVEKLQKRMPIQLFSTILYQLFTLISVPNMSHRYLPGNEDIPNVCAILSNCQMC